MREDPPTVLCMARSPRSHASPITRTLLVETVAGMIVLSAIVLLVDRGRPYATVSVVAPHSHWFLSSDTAPRQSAEARRTGPSDHPSSVRRDDIA